MSFFCRLLRLLRSRCLSPIARRFRSPGAIVVAELPPRPEVAPEHEDLVAATRERLERGALFDPLRAAGARGAVISAVYRRDGDDREYRVIAGPEGREWTCESR